MIKIEITIPLFYNDKKPIEQIKLDKIKNDLLKKFGGLTISGTNNGYWLDNNKEYQDLSKTYTIITELYNISDTEHFIKIYKKWLEDNLDQKEIFIVISDVKTI